MQVVDALHHAGTDKRVQGLVACIGRHLSSEGLAELQELRNAVHDFRLHAGYCLSCLLHLHTCPDCLSPCVPQSCLPRAFFTSFCMHASSAVVS
jgi:hypothetical protein